MSLSPEEFYDEYPDFFRLIGITRDEWLSYTEETKDE